MGEQTQQPQTQTQIQNPQPLPHIDSITATATTAEAGANTVATETSVSPANPSPLSKIPFRPRKIRKLSTDGSQDESENKSAVVDEDTKPTATTITNNKKSNNNKNKVVAPQLRIVPRITARPLSSEGEIAIAIGHLRNSDPLLAQLIDVHQPPIFDSFHPPFLALTKSILYQQLAYKAGTSIYTRFVSLCGGEAGVVPEAVIALSQHQLRQIGVSARKASYLHDLANKYRNGILSDASIVDMDDKSLFTMLTMVKGIGSWSVHMFMIFSLHRPDVLPIADVGVRKGVQLLYGLDQLPRPSQMDQLCEKWRPYRSVASWYMWRFVEAKGAQATASAVATDVTSQQQQQQHQLQLQQQQQQQHQQLLDSMSDIINLGACTWGQ